MNQRPTVAPDKRGVLTHLILDLELTGLDARTDHILEVGVIGATENLEPLFELNAVVDPSPQAMQTLALNDIVREMHQESGLLQDLLDGISKENLPSLAHVEEYIVAKITEYAGPDARVTLVGGGVSHCDMDFIEFHMPALHKRLNYWTFDTGDHRRAYKTATQSVLSDVNDSKTHRALDDVYCHIAEARVIFDMYRTIAALRASEGQVAA